MRADPASISTFAADAIYRTARFVHRTDTSLARIQSAMVVLFAGRARLKAMEAEVRGRHSAVDSGDGEDCATRLGGKERLSDD
jgi:hypothetical protein